MIMIVLGKTWCEAECAREKCVNKEGVHLEPIVRKRDERGENDPDTKYRDGSSLGDPVANCA